MKVLVAVLAMNVAAFSQNTKTLTLGEAVSIGLKNNKLLVVSAAKVAGAGAKADEANTALLPSLKFEGSYRRLSDVEPFAVTVPFYPDPIELSPTVLNTYNLRVGLQQPLFTGFKLSSNARAAEYLFGAAVADHRNDKMDMIVAITAGYWGLYQAVETRKVVEDNITRLQSYLNDTEQLMKAGLATRNDLLKIKVQIGSARLNLIDASNDIQNAMMNLNVILGLPTDTELVLADHPGTNTDSLSGNKDTFITRAMTDRADLQAMQLRTEASKAGLNAARGNWWPQIFLSGNYYYNRPNTRYMPSRDEFKSTWDIGIVMQFDIWNWGATSYQSEQAMAVVTQSELLLAHARDNVSVEVQRHFLSVNRAVEKIAVAKLAVEQAEENVRLTNEKYHNGLATSSELLDAELAVHQARVHHTGSLVEYEVAGARLKKAVGGDYE